MNHVNHSFAIHDLLTMRIRDTIGLSDRAFMRPMRGYIHYAMTPSTDFEPDIDIDIAPFEYQNADFALVDRRFRVAPDYFACEDTFKILWWKLEMTGFEQGRVGMRIDRNAFGTAAIGSRLIDCLVRYELARRGAPAIHCCGVVNDQGAYLLSGRSGVGKSTLAMRLLNDGYQLLGDNWVLVSKGEALSFHLPVNVHDYNVAPQMYARMSKELRLKMWALTVARNISGGFLKKATSVVLRDTFPEYVAERAPLRKILTFSQGSELHIAPLDRNIALQRLVVNDLMDREAFHRYMLAYATVFPDGPFGRHWEQLGEILNQAIPETVSFLDVVVPKKITPDIVSEIRSVLES